MAVQRLEHAFPTVPQAVTDIPSSTVLVLALALSAALPGMGEIHGARSSEAEQ